MVRSALNTNQRRDVAIYDNATQRDALCSPNTNGCSGTTVNDALRSIQWMPDADEMFAAGNSLHTIPVSATGFGPVTDLYGVTTDIGSSIHLDQSTGYIDTDSGNIVDARAGKFVGTFGTDGVDNSITMIPDAPLAKAFFICGGGSTGDTYTLLSFDLRTHNLVDSVTLRNIAGVPTHLIRWGTNGLAFTTSRTPSSPGSAVYILSGSFVSPSAEPPWIYAYSITPVDSYTPVIQPGEWISIFGSDLAPETATWNGDFPQSLGNTSVTIWGKPAYLWYVSPGQINLQVPDIPLKAGTVPVVVTTPSGSSSDEVQVRTVAPSILLLDNTHICAIILRPDGSGAYGGGSYDILGPTGNSLGYPTVAAKAGDIVVIFAVGLGQTSPAVLAGKPFSGAASTTDPVTLTINGVQVSPSFAGLSSAGLYQINLTIPDGLGAGDVPIFVEVTGTRTYTKNLISVQ